MDSFKERGKSSSEEDFRFKLRFAIFADGGIGISGTGRIRLGEIFTGLLCPPSVNFSIELSPVVTGNVDIEKLLGNGIVFS